LTSKEFISKKVRDFSSKGLKIFPDDFYMPGEATSVVLPSETLIIGNEFFGTYEVLTINGNSFCYADSLSRAKYLVYSARQKNRDIRIPLNEKDIDVSLKSYEKYLDSLIRQIEKEYKAEFSDGKEVHSVVNKIFRMLNLTRL
jgi:hypothetical protein